MVITTLYSVGTTISKSAAYLCIFLGVIGLIGVGSFFGNDSTATILAFSAVIAGIIMLTSSYLISKWKLATLILIAVSSWLIYTIAASLCCHTYSVGMQTLIDVAIAVGFAGGILGLAGGIVVLAGYIRAKLQRQNRIENGSRI
ncbi:MAG TPA: hypothetical protein VF172_01100 [Nitrososphaera sp.]